ncbi:hypothetical protein [Cryptosporangium arvum]|uniref:hypothetical protein n=1 Tax=Cryptosporangium arvum TaxID=80871 RepID=UPI0012EDE42C|nr:hypothetical protein [Cryptosporangium arvum]
MTGTVRRTATTVAVCALGVGLAAGLSPAAAMAAAPSGAQAASLQTAPSHGDRDDDFDWDDFSRFDRGGYWDNEWQYGRFERRHFRTIGRYRDWRECRDAAWRGQRGGYWSSFSYREVGGFWVLYA